MAITKDDIVLFPSSNDNNGNDSDLWTDYEDRRRMKMKDFQALNYKFYLENGKLRAVNKYGDFVANNIELSEDIKNYILNHPESLIDSKSLLNLRISSDKLRRPYKYEQGALPVMGPIEFVASLPRATATGVLKSLYNDASKLVTKSFNSLQPSTYFRPTSPALWNQGTYKTALGASNATLGGALADGIVASDATTTALKEFKDNPNFTTGTIAGLSTLPFIPIIKSASEELSKVPTFFRNFDSKTLNRTPIGSFSRRYFGYNPDKLLFGYNKKPSLFVDGESQIKNNLVYNQNLLLNVSNRFDEIDKIKQTTDKLKTQLEGYKSNYSLLKSEVDKNNETSRLLDTYLYYLSRKNPVRNIALNGYDPFKTKRTWNNWQRIESINFDKIKLSDFENLKAKYPTLFTSEPEEERLKQGLIRFPNFTTGQTEYFNIPHSGLEIILDPGVGLTTKGNLIGSSPMEYRNAISSNIKYIQDLIPGWKPFGSSVLAEKGLPHGTHDFDGMMTMDDFNKWRSSLTPELQKHVFPKIKGETFTYSLDGGKYGKAGDIDINLLSVDPKTGKGNERAIELFRQYYPDEYEANGKMFASLDRDDTSHFIPLKDSNGKVITSLELLGKMDPYIKSIMDAMESTKGKHITRSPHVLLDVDLDLVAKANEQSAKMLFGNNYTLLPDNVDLGTFDDRLSALTSLGFSRETASQLALNPQGVRNVFNHYLLSGPKFSRGSDAGDSDEAIGSLKKLHRNFFEYNPNPKGGDAMGGGINAVTNGPGYTYTQYVGSMQPANDFRKLLDGVNIKEVPSLIKSYLNMNNGKRIENGQEFYDFLNTSHTINGKDYHPIGFLGDTFDEGSNYFGLGPINPDLVAFRLFPGPKYVGGFEGYYHPINYRGFKGPEEISQNVLSSRISRAQKQSSDYRKGRLELLPNRVYDKILHGLSRSEFESKAQEAKSKLYANESLQRLFEGYYNLALENDRIKIPKLLDLNDQALSEISSNIGKIGDAIRTFDNAEKYNFNLLRGLNGLNLSRNGIANFFKVPNFKWKLGAGLTGAGAAATADALD